MLSGERERLHDRSGQGDRSAERALPVHALWSRENTPQGEMSTGARSFATRAARDESTKSALQASGLSRLRVMATAMMLLSQVGLIAATLLDAALPIRAMAWGSLCMLLGSFVWLWLRIERGDLSSPQTLRAFAVPVCAAVLVAHFAFGLISVFCAAVTLGLMLFASSTGRSNARLSYTSIALGTVALYGLVSLDAFAYQPLLPSRFSVRWQRDAAMVGVELVYFAAYISGRMLRREHARVVEQFERSVREASHREALLREARDAFRKASGLGSPGRFTDHELDGFRLGVVIGRGGMGEVYAAEHVASGIPAAIKLLRLDVLADETALARFEREARIVASIDSPYVVRVLAVSDADALFPYIAMERLSGVDLATYLRDRGRLPLREVTELMEQLALGLDAAHQAQVVHRDLKPNNVFRDDRERGAPFWKILDFGVSRAVGDASITAAELVGTPQYMSPEQIRGERALDPRSDIYALTAIAYRALTGRPPFEGELPRVLRNVVEQMPPAPTTLVRAPRDLDAVIAIGLAKQPEQRFANARELARAFVLGVRGELPEVLRSRARAILAQKPYAA